MVSIYGVDQIYEHLNQYFPDYPSNNFSYILGGDVEQKEANIAKNDIKMNTNTIAARLSEDKNLSKFAELILSNKFFKKYLDTDNVTIFAVENNGFDSVQSAVDKLAEEGNIYSDAYFQTRLHDFLSSYITPTKIYPVQLYNRKLRLNTVLSNFYNTIIGEDKNNYIVNVNNTSKILYAIECTNGFIYVISNAIYPPLYGITYNNI